MRLLIAMAQSYFPRQAGGMQVVTRDLAGALAGRGHDIAIAAEMSLKGFPGLVSALRAVPAAGRYARESWERVPVFRARKIASRIGAILEAFQPGCVILQSMDAMGMARDIAAAGVPLVVCWHDVETQRLAGSPAGLPARFVANSEFTAGVYHTAFGINSAIIPPLIIPERFRAETLHPAQVTFVNPVPDKGVDIALEVAAACPDIPFEFVESWILPEDRKSALLTRLRSLPNTRFTPHQGDMRPVYGRTRIMLVPSQWREAWGRVASEAHVNGIPVIASAIGGLPESVGPGGILLAPDAPSSQWIAAVRDLWDGPERYAALSAAARSYAARQELDPSWAVESMLREVTEARALRHASS